MTRAKSMLILAIVGILVTMLACNLPMFSNSGLTSFDQAHLMMLTSRGMLGLYDPDAEMTSSSSNVIRPVSFTNPQMAFSSLEEINQLKALEQEYKQMAAMAEKSGNTQLAETFISKAARCSADAGLLELDRESWRYHHRFDNVIRRISRGLGRGVGEIIGTTGDIAVDSVRYTVKNYGDEIKQFIRNPVKYGINLAGQRQLDIIKHQFTDRLGPVLGGQVIRILRIDRISHQMESAIMGPDKQKTANAEKTKVAASAGQEPATSGDPPAAEEPKDMWYEAKGNWQGAVIDTPEYNIVSNEARLEFQAEGGPVKGELLLAYTFPNDHCPMSSMIFYLPITGMYAEDTGFILTGEEYRSYDIYLYNSEDGSCPRTKQTRVLTGKKYDLVGVMALNHDRYEINLTVSEIGNPSKNGQIFLVVEEGYFGAPEP